MRRALIAVTDLLLAFLTALTGLGLGLLAEAASFGASASRALVISASMAGGPALMQGVVALWSLAIAVSFAPVALAVLVGESLDWREPVWYGGAAGVAAAGSPTLLAAIVGSPMPHGMAPAEGRLTLLLFLGGVASGLVYWAVAGRDAGQR